MGGDNSLLMRLRRRLANWLGSSAFRTLHWICMRTPPKMNTAEDVDHDPTDKRKGCIQASG